MQLKTLHSITDLLSIARQHVQRVEALSERDAARHQIWHPVLLDQPFAERQRERPGVRDKCCRQERVTNQLACVLTLV